MAFITPSLLEQVLGAKSKVAILRVLFQSRLGYSGSAIARRAGMGLLAIQNALVDLEQVGLVEVERGSVEYRYRLNTEHYLVTNGLRGLYEGERLMTRALARDLRSLLDGQVVSAGLFGSFARGRARKGSDIDLLIIVNTLKERERVSKTLSDVLPRLSRRYGWPIQPVIYERRRIMNGTRHMQELLNEADRDWQPIAGVELRQLRQEARPTATLATRGQGSA